MTMAVEYTIQDNVQHFFSCPSALRKVAGKAGEIHYGMIKNMSISHYLCCQASMKQITQGRYTWKPLTWPLNLHLFETLYFRSLNDSTKNEWQEKEV